MLALDTLHEDGQDTAGNLTLTPDTERLLAEVYATGSGGGCEEFWYFATTADGYWCHASHGPYREVQVLVDGRVAGIAAPYPHIYTGGWSNPFLWYAIPAPRAFDIAPIRYELTPFIGLLNDGKPHEIRFRVLGLEAGREGWKLMPNVQVWRDPSGKRVSARLLQAEAGEVMRDGDLDAHDPQQQRVLYRWQRRFLARDEVKSSRGIVQTTVERSLEGDLHHRWTRDEDGDDHLLAEWRDLETITRTPKGGSASSDTLDQRFGLDGSLVTAKVEGKPRLTTTLDIHDDGKRTRTDADGTHSAQTRDRFTGSAAYTSGVPREQRNAIVQSRQVWRHEDDVGCQQRSIATVNGYFVEDASGCTAPPQK